MTDPAHLDELASAHLDGTTSPEEAAQVAADPALQARVEDLRAVRAAVGALPPVDPARRDTAIAAALAAFEEGASGAEAHGPAAGITSLATVATRRGPSPRALRLVGVAAAVVVLAALVPLLGQLGSSDDAETASRDPASEETGGALSDDAASGVESAPAAGSAVPEETSTSAAALPTDLGRFDDLAALVAAVDARASQEIGDAPTSVEAGGNSGDGCLSERSTQARANGARTIATAIATIDGDDVVALIVTDANGGRTLQVFLTDTCTLLAERAL